MMVKCDRHGGYQGGVLCSPDLVKYSKSGEKYGGIIRQIRYYFEDTLVHVLVFSDEFSKENNILETGDIPLPDDFPLWIKKLGSLCELCAIDLKETASNLYR